MRVETLKGRRGKGWVLGPVFRASDFRFRVSSFRFQLSGSEFRVKGFKFGISRVGQSAGVPR